MILAELGKPASLKQHTEDRPGQVDRHIGSTDKAAELLGWRSSIAFEDGLRRTIEWYRENPQWWQAVLAGETATQAV
jgi:dTDP-glucose 4,6-dehydratase